ncbi:hypothetical protein [Brevibacillus panacihumi]|uniref:hypothetical protein n=1 Tax=Brevibacillus panacihumi TaxID=497735 RepID=UPI003D19BEA9
MKNMNNTAIAHKRHVQESEDAINHLFDEELELDVELDDLEDYGEDVQFVADEEYDVEADETDEEDEAEESEDEQEDDYSEDDDENYEETEGDDEDLLTVKKLLRKPKLDEDDYVAKVGPPKAKKMATGEFGPWVKITIPFLIKHPDTKEGVTVEFSANRSIDSKSRLYPVLKGILGTELSNEIDLRDLEGRKVKVSIEHRKDEEGNVWENIVSVRKYTPKR